MPRVRHILLRRLLTGTVETASHRSVRLTFALFAVVAAIVGAAVFSYQGNVSLGGVGLILLILGLPLLVYVAAIRSRIGSIVIGVGLVVLVAAVQAYVTGRGSSSTAAVGYLYLFLYGLPLVLVAVVIEQLLTRRR